MTVTYRAGLQTSMMALCLAAGLASAPVSAQQPPLQLAPPAGAAKPAQPAPPAPVAAPAPAPVSGLATEQQAIVKRIGEVYNTVREMQGEFLQVEPDGNRTTGKFYLTKPGKVRFQYDRPSPIEIISDGDSVIVRDRKLNTQDLYPLSQTPLRYLLREKIDLLKDAKVVGAYQDQDLLTVTIEEKGTFSSGQLTLYFSATDYSLRQWTITDARGLETAVRVSNVATDKRNDAKLFRIDYTQMINTGGAN